jgi:hypothetical protein
MYFGPGLWVEGSLFLGGDYSASPEMENRKDEEDGRRWKDALRWEIKWPPFGTFPVTGQVQSMQCKTLVLIQEELTKEERQDSYATRLLKGVAYVSSCSRSHMRRRSSPSIQHLNPDLSTRI